LIADTCFRSRSSAAASTFRDAGKPGLGGHLHAALGGGIVIVGVAKTAYRGGVALAITRGQSQSPLFVTAAGLDAARAAELVRAMHGPFRLPDLLKRVDLLARGLAPPGRACAPSDGHSASRRVDRVTSQDNACRYRWYR
jgi:deoxyribonuclease V